MKLSYCIFFLFISTMCGRLPAHSRQEVAIIPAPRSLITGTHSFSLSSGTTICVNDKRLLLSAGYLRRYLKQYYHLNIRISPHPKGQGTILLQRKPGSGTPSEGYSLQCDPSHIRITGSAEAGVFYGVQSLIQLLPLSNGHPRLLKIPEVQITDSPAFAYRGLMLDCARHFFPVAFVKRYIDFIALHKMNTFHWHLTDDQGWRIEIRKYPALTRNGAWRNGTVTGHFPDNGNDHRRSGGFYTRQQIRDIVRYAADRYVTIIPEIEMPGHASAAIAAYPQLSCFPEQPTDIPPGTCWNGSTAGKQVQQTWGIFKDVYVPNAYTFRFLTDVLTEVMALFPSRYIHIGGDECPKDYWKQSAYCQALMKEKGMANEDGLQSYFIQRIAQFLNSKGRRLIGWDEILEGGIAADATIMSWRGENGGITAARLHHKVIMTPGNYLYFDHAQQQQEDSITIGGYLPIQKVYQYNPVPRELDSPEATFVTGAQANVWTEYMGNPDKVTYMLFPRMAALSEVLWLPAKARDYNAFKTRLQTQLKRYRLWGIYYCPRWDNQP